MKKYLFVLLFTFVNVFIAFEQVYTFKNFNHTDGLSLIHVNCINQSPDGTLYFGTEGSGILKYTGNKFEEVNLKSKCNHHITNVNYVDENKLNFTSKYKGFYSLNNGKLNHLYKSDIQYSSDIYDYIKYKNGYFVFKERNIVYQSKRELTLLKLFKSKENKFIKVIDLGFGAIVFTTQNTFYFNFKSKKFHSLSNFLQLKNSKIYKATFHKNELTLFDSKNPIYFIFKISKSKKLTLINKYKIKNQLKIQLVAQDNYGNYIIIDQDNKLCKLKKSTVKPIVWNSTEKIFHPKSIYIDHNNDIWIASASKGIYRISLEPFTRLNKNQNHINPLIAKYYKSINNEELLYILGGKTYITDRNQKTTLIPEKTLSYIHINDEIYLGTSKGIKIFNLKTHKLSSFNLSKTIDQKISLLYKFQNNLWIGVSDFGLIKYDLKTLKSEAYCQEYYHFPKYFYTAQTNFDSTNIIFGSNNLFHKYSIKNNSFKWLGGKKINQLGTYCGVSARDIYGTRWFTLENGIVGYLNNGKRVILSNQKYFNSTLFYTLTTDIYGNLILGTNKGLTILKVNEKGEVISTNFYNHENGFEGFEAHMRSQHSDGKLSYIGTIEGLFLVNSAVLENLPVPSRPSVILEQKLNKSSNNLKFKINSINAKSKNILYSFRLYGYQNKWSKPAKINSQNYYNLSSGNYIFQVRSTIDGKKFSPIKTLEFKIKIPFWKSNWFVIFVAFGFVLLNIYLYNQFKTFDPKQLFSGRAISTTYKYAPYISLFSILINFFGTLFFVKIQNETTVNFNLTIYSSLILSLLYFYILKFKKNHFVKKYINHIIVFNYIIIVIHFYCQIIFTSIHPYFVILTMIVVSFSPFFLEKIKQILTFSLFIVILSGIIFSMIEFINFNKYLFLISVIIAVTCSIFIAFLRFDSMSKLFFISGVINKGNLPTIAFDENGKITYASDNVSNFMDISSEELINKPISILNKSIEINKKHEYKDLTNDFVDGSQYLVPMILSNNRIVWMEWLCKSFSKEIRVIIGQDVTKRIELESSYEALIQNVEDFIYEFDINGIFSFINKKLLSKLGYTERELIGEHTLKIVESSSRESVQEYYLNHIKKSLKTSYLEFPITSKSGEVMWIGQHVTSFFDSQNSKHIKTMLAVARDITEIRKQQEIIQEQSKDIKDSINYAKRIQLSLLPSNKKLNQFTNEFFTLYQPKDIVSGDFYWVEQIDQYTFFILGDCTGHGVPGSFMTLLGINFLNSIILEQKILDPFTIVKYLDKKMYQILNKGTEDTSLNDGIDIVICCLNTETLEMTYFNAGMKFLIIKNGKLEIQKGNPLGIGDNQYTNENFTSEKIQLKSNDLIYLFSDGIQDQFGGNWDKKFTFKRLCNLIEDNQRLPLLNQKEMIEEEIEDWKGKHPQTDDITLIGFKI